MWLRTVEGGLLAELLDEVLEVDGTLSKCGLFDPGALRSGN